MAAGSDISNVLVKIVYLPNSYFSGVVQNTSSYNNSPIFFPKVLSFCKLHVRCLFFCCSRWIKMTVNCGNTVIKSVCFIKSSHNSSFV